MAVDALGVGTPPCWAFGVVGTDGIPGVTQALDVAGEDPGAHLDVGAGIE